MVRALAASAVALAGALAAAAVAETAFMLRSSVFGPGGKIPRVHTCDGRNLSPALRWTAPPPGTRSFALLMDDPDAPSGTFTHWLAWGIPAKARSLPLGGRAPAEGRNDAGRIGYIGPCPPSGRHRYVFRLYALRAPLRLARGASRAAFLTALRGKVLAAARLVGTYER